MTKVRASLATLTLTLTIALSFHVPDAQAKTDCSARQMKLSVSTDSSGKGLDAKAISRSQYAACAERPRDRGKIRSHYTTRKAVAAHTNSVEKICADSGRRIANRILMADCEFEAPPAEPGAPAEPAPPPIVVSVADLQNLPIAPSGLSVQPPVSPVLINVPTIAYTGPQPQDFEITMFGQPVWIRVEPASYTWDFGERAPFTTTTPGRPYPNQNIYYEYKVPTDPGETRQITLTTHWQGWWSTDGISWLPVDGEATTTESSIPFEVVERRSRLVLPTD